jgi:small conductance mechanosensitive channel
MRHFFTTDSHSWRDVGLARQLSRRAVKRARIQSLVLLPALVGVLVVYGYRTSCSDRRTTIRSGSSRSWR